MVSSGQEPPDNGCYVILHKTLKDTPSDLGHRSFHVKLLSPLCILCVLFLVQCAVSIFLSEHVFELMEWCWLGRCSTSSDVLQPFMVYLFGWFFFQLDFHIFFL
jgi:hypothetical protein